MEDSKVQPPPLIVVTRPTEQAEGFCALLSKAGYQVQALPTIEIVPTAPCPAHAQAIAKLTRGDYDWLIFTSVNGIRCFASHIATLPASIKIICVGAKTAQALKATFERTPEIVPSEFSSRGIAAALETKVIKGTRFLWPTTGEGSSFLEDYLSARGGCIEKIVVYQTRSCAVDRAILESLTTAHAIFTFFSPSAFLALKGALDQYNLDLGEAAFVTVGPVTSKALQSKGWRVTAEAAEPSDQAVLEAIGTLFNPDRTA